MLAAQFTYFISLFLFSFVFAGIFIRFIMLILSLFWIRREKSMIKSAVNYYPKVSLLIPAYNEEDTIIESITHAINADYPDLEVIVVNDGSKDSTLSLMIEAFNLLEDNEKQITEEIPTQQIKQVFKSESVEHLVVINKENGGKADALNCAVNASSAEYVLALDADTHLTKNTIRYLIRPVIQDKNIVVTSGSVRIMSKKNSIFNNLQKAEFVNSISLFRTGWNYINANLIVSGALGLFNKKVLFDVNGYHNLAIGEDMELIIRIHRNLLEKGVSYKILQFALPTCFTQAVPNIKEMISQRKRWQKGLLSSLRLNTSLFFNPRYKSIGMIALPFYILFELMAPFIELMGLFFYAFLLIFGGTAFSLIPEDNFMLISPFLVWCAGLVFAVLNDWLSITIDKVVLRGMSWKEYFNLLLAACTSPFFYHFLQLYCKIKGTIEYLSTIQTSTKWDTKR